MNATTQTMHHPPERASAFRWIASASVMEAIIAIAVIALAIVGLARDYSVVMAAIATIITSAAVLIEGGAFDKDRVRNEMGAMAGGLGAEILGAIAGIILGVLALMGVASITLLSVAVLVFGVTFLLNSASISQGSQGVIQSHLLIGLSVSVLGLLAIIGIAPVTLILVGLLVLGAIMLFGGSLKSLNLMNLMGSAKTAM